MGRVTQQKTARQNGVAGSTRGAQAAKNRKKTQKVVLESNSKDKNQLRSVISFRVEPPPGYTFIPAGNPQLTAALKEFARRENRKIHQVSTTPHASRHELSREVHRVGYHFPTDIVAKVCAHYDIRLTSGGRVINDNNNNDQIVMRVYQKGQLVLDEKVQDQITINTDAKETIKDLFPNIPNKDLYQIIKTAFQLGDGKVGTADEIPLVRRAQLSVVAHIRHTYTNYDKLLRRLPYNQARHAVEEITLKKLVEWRGDDDEKADDSRRRAVDDLVREVIVVSDEEDSGSDVDEAEQIRYDELKVEELPSGSYGPPQHRPLSPSRDFFHEEAPSGYRFVPLVARRYRLTEAEVDARDLNRRAIWEQARAAYRSRLPEPEPQYERVYLGRTSPTRTLIPIDPPVGSVVRREYLGSIPPQRPVDHEMLQPSRPLSPRYSGFMTDGRRYERIPLDDPSVSAPVRRRSPLNDAHHPSRPLTPTGLQQQQRRRSASPDVGRGTVLPSIEGPNGAYSPPQARQPAADNTRTWPTPPSNFTTRREAPAREPAIIDLSSGQEHTSNRRRVDNPFQARDRYVFPESSQSMHENSSPRPYPQRQFIDVEPHRSGAGEAIFRDAHPPQQADRYREIQKLDQFGVRRILIPEDDVRSHRVDDYPSAGTYGHPNPFGERSSTSQVRLLEPLPTQQGGPGRSASGARPPSPPRRMLEALPSERYPTHPYQPGDRVPIVERRIIYASTPSSQASDRRYERPPETTYVQH